MMLGCIWQIYALLLGTLYEARVYGGGEAEASMAVEIGIESRDNTS